MQIAFDPAKRELTLRDRKLDFADAALVLNAKDQWTRKDERRDYGEVRHITIGLLRDRLVVVVWTKRLTVTHVISMRKANAREKKLYQEFASRSGG
jgi:uncharacterized DUF497 family protein